MEAQMGERTQEAALAVPCTVSVSVTRAVRWRTPAIIIAERLCFGRIDYLVIPQTGDKDKKVWVQEDRVNIDGE